MFGYTIVKKSKLKMWKKFADKYIDIHKFMWWFSVFPLDELRKYIQDDSYFGGQSACRKNVADDMNKFYGINKIDSMGNLIKEDLKNETN